MNTWLKLTGSKFLPRHVRHDVAFCTGVKSLLLYQYKSNIVKQWNFDQRNQFLPDEMEKRTNLFIIPQNMHMVCSLLCFVVSNFWTVLPKVFRVASSSLAQSYYRLSVRKVTLMNMCKCIPCTAKRNVTKMFYITGRKADNYLIHCII